MGICSKTGAPHFIKDPKTGDQTTEAELYDQVSYIVATGNDYDTEKTTEPSHKIRLDFINAFPDYAGFSFWRLQFIPNDEKRMIMEWFYN